MYATVPANTPGVTSPWTNRQKMSWDNDVGSREGRRDRDGERRSDDDAAEAQRIGQPADAGRGEGDGDGRGRDGQADRESGRVKGAREQRQQRLGRVEVHERGEARQHHRDDRQPPALSERVVSRRVEEHCTILLPMTLPCRIALAASLVFATLIPVPAQSPGGVKAFTGARVIDGTDRAPIDNATIVVRGGKVVAVGPGASVTVPAGAERIA
jgi:hypothetical protein